MTVAVGHLEARLQPEEASRPRGPSAWRRLARDRLALVGLGLLVIIVCLAVGAPLVARHDPLDQNPADKLQGPGAEYLLGTDRLGRSIWARLVWGARLTLGTASMAMVLILVIGLGVGVVAGYFGGWLDAALMRAVDFMLAFPSLLLAMAIVGMLGSSLVNVMLAIVAVGWAGYARLVRGMVLSVREQDYVEAARALGMPPWLLLARHVVPNILSPVVVLVSLDMGEMLLAISGLSFLGMGAQAPTPEWGRMLNDARAVMHSAPLNMIFPGLAIFLTVMAFNLLGDGLRDALDPQSTAPPR